MDTNFKERIATLDRELPSLAKPILVLKHLNWPDALEESFIESWHQGKPCLPKVESQIPDWTVPINDLEQFAQRCRGDDPILNFLERTALSYAEAGRMLMASGTAEFTERSIQLYGRPDDPYATQWFTGVDAADFLLEKTDQLYGSNCVAPVAPTIPAELFAERLRQAVQQYFADDKVDIVVDNALSSKAIAGTTKIRIRGSAVFSELDFDQLFQHEALVHMATAINGGRQENLKSLSLGAPRTTRTQEGIAVFAELATRSIDIARLRRLALRIKALKAALDGADFIDCFKYFLEAGQDERESYKSAQRIFRGGDVRGHVAFTKDSVYLKGVMEMHVLMNIAIRDNQPQLVKRLFAGRLTMGDAITLEPYFESGFLKTAHYLPPWANDLGRLAASLAYSAFMMNVDLASVDLSAFTRAQ